MDGLASWCRVAVAGVLIVSASACDARADVYGWAFRPGSNVPAGFKPSEGVDASGLDLRGSYFIGMSLRGAKFDGCDLRDAAFLQVSFAGLEDDWGRASFRGADLRGVWFEEPDIYGGCDFTDALINRIEVDNAQRHFLSLKQIRSTKSYKLKDLSYCYIMIEDRHRRTGPTSPELMPARSEFAGFNLEGATLAHGDFTACDFTNTNIRGICLHNAKVTQSQIKASKISWDWVPMRDDPYHHHATHRDGNSMRAGKRGFSGMAFCSMDLTGWSFRGEDLENTFFAYSKLDGVDFSDAVIRGAFFFASAISREQLRSTKSYREGDLSGVGFVQLDFTNFDFSGQNLTGVRFQSCDLTGADFTNALITRATASDTTESRRAVMTADQIKSTWNYKNNRMEGIDLPEEPPPRWTSKGRLITEGSEKDD